MAKKPIVFRLPGQLSYRNWEMCGKKVKYKTLEEANEGWFSKKKKRLVYRCPRCKNWHRTTRKKPPNV